MVQALTHGLGFRPGPPVQLGIGDARQQRLNIPVNRGNLVKVGLEFGKNVVVALFWCFEWCCAAQIAEKLCPVLLPSRSVERGARPLAGAVFF